MVFGKIGREGLGGSGNTALSTQSVLQRQADGTVYAGVIGSKWRSSVLLFASDSDCIPIVGAVLSLKF